MIIQDERLAAASVFLPLTKNPSISTRARHPPPGGDRHHQRSDAISIVVSEETGLITYVERGKVNATSTSTNCVVCC